MEADGRKCCAFAAEGRRFVCIPSYVHYKHYRVCRHHAILKQYGDRLFDSVFLDATFEPLV